MIRPMQLYRASRWCKEHLPGGHGSYLFKLINRILNGIDIAPDAEIAEDCKIFHPVGIVIGRCRVEPGCAIYSGAKIVNTVRFASGEKERGYPVIGRGSILFSNSVVVGSVTLAPSTVCGANSVIFRSTKEGETCVGCVK